MVMITIATASIVAAIATAVIAWIVVGQVAAATLGVGVVVAAAAISRVVVGVETAKLKPGVVMFGTMGLWSRAARNITGTGPVAVVLGVLSDFLMAREGSVAFEADVWLTAARARR